MHASPDNQGFLQDGEKTMRTYKRYTIRLRFEPGEPVPAEGDSFTAETVFGHIPVKCKVLKVKWQGKHEDGATLMDCVIGRSNLA